MERLEQMQVRVSKEEKELAKELADVYGLSGGASELVRLALRYIDENRPSLTITISPTGKALAPDAIMVLN